MSRAKLTTARLIDQRARRRATQALLERHRDEFRQLYDEHRAKAEREAQQLEAAHQDRHDPVEPVRLLPGARLAGQTTLERIDVARCSLCVKNHDRNHVCPRCGSVPAHTLAEQIEAVQQMTARGATVQQISTTLRLPVDRVVELASAPAAAPEEETG